MRLEASYMELPGPAARKIVLDYEKARGQHNSTITTMIMNLFPNGEVVYEASYMELGR